MPQKDPAVRRAYMRRYQNEWMSVRRQEWIDANGPCRHCGSWKDLECDHIDPEAKTLPPRALWSLAPTNPVRVSELAKCQALCQSCHRKKSAKEHARFCANRHARPILSNRDAATVAQRAVAGEPASVIARDYGINRSTVYKIRDGKVRWSPELALPEAA